jgi:RND superfamily putative drug exporter
MHLGFPDDGAQPAGSLPRRAYDLTRAHYGAGRTGPLLLAVEAADPAGVADRLADRVRVEPGVATLSPPFVLPSGRAALLTLVPEGAPQDPPVAALVRAIRERIGPELAAETSGARVGVGGVVATTIDVADLIEEQLPVALVVVLCATFGLLLVVFRSVLVPLKAVVMNLLSVGAAYGVLVMVFQWGWGRSLLGLDAATPISSILPLLLFTLLFGLSMDYEVFLLTRVREEHDRGADTTASVATALARTGRVVTSAAAIMVVVFCAFALGPDPIIKMFGVGLAAAILLDATVVRAVLVPATMVLLGETNWWLPRWLDRWLPTLRVE